MAAPLYNGKRFIRNAVRPTILTGFGWAAIQITTFNHAFVDSYASKRKIGRASNWIIAISHFFYNAGVIVGLLGICLIPLFLALRVFATLYDLGISREPTTALVPMPESVNVATNGPTLLIPGLTTPLRDLPIVLSASFLAILIHELGHAMAAGLSGIPLVSTGFLLVCIFPGAYVSLANEKMDLLAPLQRLQIICSGVWHNFVLALALWAFASSEISSFLSNSLFRCLGYQSTDERAVVLLRVAKTSPLSSIMHPGTMITHLDDFELHDPEHWDRYLLADSTSRLMQSEDLGWCIALQELIDRSGSCCDSLINTSSESQAGAKRDVCFISATVVDTQSPRGCLDPSTVLAKTRCIEECPQPGDICIRPAPQERLLRLSISDPHSLSQISVAGEVIFYQGDRLQLWKETRVGNLIPPRWLPLGLPYDVTLFFNYLRTISVSLGMLNLLPLPRLDGGEILQVLLYAPAATLPKPNVSAHRSQQWTTEDVVQRLLQSRLRRRLASKGSLVELSVSWSLGALLASTVAVAIWREVLPA